MFFLVIFSPHFVWEFMQNLSTTLTVGDGAALICKEFTHFLRVSKVEEFISNIRCPIV